MGCPGRRKSSRSSWLHNNSKQVPGQPGLQETLPQKETKSPCSLPLKPGPYLTRSLPSSWPFDFVIPVMSLWQGLRSLLDSLLLNPLLFSPAHTQLPSACFPNPAAIPAVGRSHRKHHVPWSKISRGPCPAHQGGHSLKATRTTENSYIPLMNKDANSRLMSPFAPGHSVPVPGVTWS